MTKIVKKRGPHKVKREKTHNAVIEGMIGRKFEKLTVVSVNGTNKNHWTFNCLCDCGQTRVCAGSELRLGRIKRCRECKKKIHRKPGHGKKGMSIWVIWCGIKARCLNPNNRAYKNYGGRGITIDESWHKFENFYRDMGDRPQDLQIDRIDNDGPYTKSNCRWVTAKENCKNRRKYASGNSSPLRQV